MTNKKGHCSNKKKKGVNKGEFFSPYSSDSRLKISRMTKQPIMPPPVIARVALSYPVAISLFKNGVTRAGKTR